ncbi:peptidase M28 [Novacetimonas maltaceti]|nr:peptidase M28 [Novacetimonas maltaceti]
MATSPDILYGHVKNIYPVFRSITGKGIRQTLEYISGKVKDLSISHVASGTEVLDWTVPEEWNAYGATIRRTTGEVMIDWAWCNLHLLQYSIPVHARVSRSELEKHLYWIEEQPDLIPYRTSYYRKDWGFCLSAHQRSLLTDDEYDVDIRTELGPGRLSYGEILIPATAPGQDTGEVLFSIHCCHPALANDNASSVAIAIEVIRELQARTDLRLSYRFIFIPGTIGSITWLARNRDTVRYIRHGLVLSCLGDAGAPTYKQSRQGNAAIDRYAAYLVQARWGGKVVPFEPYGYDERQYCSPGFNLAVGCLMRSPNGQFAQYHTSADNLDFVTPAGLHASFGFIMDLVAMMEKDFHPISLCPYGEPQLGRRGLYRAIGGHDGDDPESAFDQMTLLWVLNLADGKHSLLDIAQRAGKPFPAVAAAAEALMRVDLLARPA